MTAPTRPAPPVRPAPSSPPAPSAHRTHASPPAAAAAVPRRGRSWRRVLTAVAMVVVCVAVVVFAVVVRVALANATTAVTTVGQNDTAGIRAAQRVRSDLAEIDLLTTQELLAPTATKGDLPDAYVKKQKELVADLDTAGAQITLGAAETVPLANLQYERAQYQALVRDAILADQDGDRARALTLEAQAHDVMVGSLGLQDQADALDKANTYALNQSYEDQKSTSSSSWTLLLGAGLVLLGLLFLVQVGHVAAFRRVFNVGLVGASLLAVGILGFSTSHIDSSKQHLIEAREHAFDPVHQLWQARASAFSARQAEAQALLDSSRAGDAEDRFQRAAGRLYRLPGEPASVADSARHGALPVGAGGYLANVLNSPVVSPEATAATTQTLAQFGAYLEAHQTVSNAASSGRPDSATASFLGTGSNDNGPVFSHLVDSIDKTLALNEAAFDANAQAAASALDGLELANLLCAAAMVLLVIWGLSQRLREYSGV